MTWKSSLGSENPQKQLVSEGIHYFSKKCWIYREGVRLRKDIGLLGVVDYGKVNMREEASRVGLFADSSGASPGLSTQNPEPRTHPWGASRPVGETKPERPVLQSAVVLYIRRAEQGRVWRLGHIATHSFGS